MGRRKSYRSEDLDTALLEASNGSSISLSHKKYNVSVRILQRKMKNTRDGYDEQRPGPKSLLINEMEDGLFQWIMGMQRLGFPPSRDVIVMETNEMFKTLYGGLRSVVSLRRGWCDRFMQRHPNLSLCAATVIKSARNEVTLERLRYIFID